MGYKKALQKTHLCKIFIHRTSAENFIIRACLSSLLGRGEVLEKTISRKQRPLLVLEGKFLPLAPPGKEDGLYSTGGGEGRGRRA